MPALAKSHFSGQTLIKLGESVDQAVDQGFSLGSRKASLTLKMQDYFVLTLKSEGTSIVSFKLLLPPVLYSSSNEAIIHDDKILERICIIHFFS